MVRIGGDSSRRSARHVRYDDIPTDTFTPRTYQVLDVIIIYNILYIEPRFYLLVENFWIENLCPCLLMLVGLNLKSYTPLHVPVPLLVGMYVLHICVCVLCPDLLMVVGLNSCNLCTILQIPLGRFVLCRRGWNIPKVWRDGHIRTWTKSERLEQFIIPYW